LIGKMMVERYGMLLERSKDELDPEACLDQIDRLISSPLLQGSDGLCRLIRFLAKHALDSPSEHLKEYQIATEALGRSPGFDPHSDASVRIQVTRLRDKLAEYYRSVGTRDPILIEIPKGSYTLTFQKRTIPVDQSFLVQATSGAAPATDTRSPRFRKTVFIALAFLVGVLTVAGVLVARARHPRLVQAPASANNAKHPPTALATFWEPFVHAPEQPFVVFKTLPLIGSYVTGMRLFDPSRDNPKQEIQHFTGIGETMGMLELAQQFDRTGSGFRAKRESLFTIDDARHSDLIYVGSPSSALSVGEILGTREFTFRRQRAGPDPYRWEIVESHPRPGDTGVYYGSSDIQPIETDYAIIALKRGLDPSRWTLLLEGTSTEATQAAVDYVCNESSVAGMLNGLHIKYGAHLKPFEGLLQVKIADAVPVETELLDLRGTGN
jgi:hypothetical protein